MDKQKNLCEILERLTHPAIPEIAAYINMNAEQQVCRGMNNLYYQSVLHYLKKLEENGRVHFLTCSSGYRNRYCIGTELERPKNKLRPLVRFRENTSYGDYVYTLGKNRIRICLSVNANAGAWRDSESIVVLLDSDLARHYVVDNTLIVGVIRRSDMKHPRLPGPTFGWGTEYERCLKLMRNLNGDMRILGVKGERKVTEE